MNATDRAWLARLNGLCGALYGELVCTLPKHEKGEHCAEGSGVLGKPDVRWWSIPPPEAMSAKQVTLCPHSLQTEACRVCVGVAHSAAIERARSHLAATPHVLATDLRDAQRALQDAEHAKMGWVLLALMPPAGMPCTSGHTTGTAPKWPARFERFELPKVAS